MLEETKTKGMRKDKRRSSDRCWWGRDDGKNPGKEAIDSTRMLIFSNKSHSYPTE